MVFWRKSETDHAIVKKQTNLRLRPPPYNLTLFKGLKNVILHRNFVDFLLDSEVAKHFYDWVKDTNIPDETYIQTLARVRVKDKRVVQQLRANTTHGICVRRSLWHMKSCHGEMKRCICNLALQDLPFAINNGRRQLDGLQYADNSRHFGKECFFLNKFSQSIDPLAPFCLAQHVSKEVDY